MYKGSQTNRPELNHRYKSTNEIVVIDVSRRLNSGGTLWNSRNTCIIHVIESEDIQITTSNSSLKLHEMIEGFLTKSI